MKTTTIKPQAFAFFDLAENQRTPQAVFQADVEGLAADLDAAVNHLMATSLRLQEAMDQAPSLVVPADWQKKLADKIVVSMDITKRLRNSCTASGNQNEMNAWQREIQRRF